MTKKFSLILNSRKRPHLLRNLLNSIFWKTTNHHDISVLISCDSDDTLTQTQFNQFDEIWQGNLPTFASIEYIERERNLHKRLNDLVLKTKSKYIWILNDDVEICTYNWDVTTWHILEESNNIIKYGSTQDNSCDKEAQYSSFPILSRNLLDKWGFLYPPDIVGLGVDVILHRIFQELNQIIEIPIEINHKLHTTTEQVLNPDETAAEMRLHTYSNYINPFKYDITEYLNKLT